MSGVIQSGRFGSTLPTPPLAGPTLWLDASYTSSITSSGGAVSQIDDLSGNGYHFTQTTAGSKPTTGTVTQNSLNVLDHDGTDDHLVGPLFTTITDNLTMFVVIKPDAAPAAGTCPFFIGNGGANGYGIGFRTSPNNNVGLLRGGVAWHESATTPSSSGGHIITLRRTSGAWTVRYDLAATTVSTSSNPNTPGTATYIGTHSPPGGAGVGFLNGGFCEALFYSSSLSDADRDTVESSLKTKWATA